MEKKPSSSPPEDLEIKTPHGHCTYTDTSPDRIRIMDPAGAFLCTVTGRPLGGIY